MKTRSECHQQESFENIPWVVGRPEGYLFAANPLEINASPSTVWEMIKNVGEYQHYSQGAVTASLPDGVFGVGATIHLVLYKDECVGKFIPSSDETISVVDEQNHIAAWERGLPGGGHSECYRVLEPLENGARTRSHIALKIPGFAGFFTHGLLKDKIEHAFNQVNQGIKQAAEEQEQRQAFL